MCMSGGGSPAPVAPVAALPPPPTAVDPAVLMARSNIQAAAAAAQGRGATIGAGATDSSTDNKGAKVLLGT